MSYERVPHQFMQGIFIAPKNFNDPQNPEHGQYVNAQMKNDLYQNTLFKITSCQFGLLGSSEEEIQVKQIKECSGPDPVWGLSSKINNKATQSTQMLACMDWKILRSIKNKTVSASQYRVKIMQTQEDLFYSELHPPSLWKLFKYYIFS